MEQKPYTRGRDLDHVAWVYDFVHEKLSLGQEKKFRQKTLDHMSISPTERILDVGCGTGSLTLLIAERLTRPGEAVGVDAAPKMIERARRKAAARPELPASFLTGVAEKLILPDASFDVVVNSMFSHHVDTELKKAAFHEMYRVLRPGGILLTADVDKPTTVWGKLSGWGARYLLFQKELEDNLRGDLPAIIAGAGFTEIRQVDHLYGLVSFYTARKTRD